MKFARLDPVTCMGCQKTIFAFYRDQSDLKALNRQDVPVPTKMRHPCCGILNVWAFSIVVRSQFVGLISHEGSAD